MDDSKEQILVDFSNQTPNLQEGCQFTIVSNRNNEQEKTYKIKEATQTTYSRGSDATKVTTGLVKDGVILKAAGNGTSVTVDS